MLVVGGHQQPGKAHAKRLGEGVFDLGSVDQQLGTPANGVAMTYSRL